MEHYIVKGGNPLTGEVEIAGAKNAALGILAASVMTNETVTLENIPDVSDIRAILKAIQSIGAHVEKIDRHCYRINGSMINHNAIVDNDYVRKIRGSYYLIGALLGKHRRASVALPGGCNIGLRPIDQHIKGFRALGADVRLAPPGMVIAEAEVLRGAHIYMDVVSVGATINIMMASVMADGVTIIENAAKEPHVVDTANFLNSMGARIKGAGTDVIRIKGVEKLHGTNYSIIPDQIEAGTFMFAAAATKGDVVIKNVIPKHLESLTAKLLEIGCQIHESDDEIRVVATRTKMGAHIQVEGNSAIVDGVEKYTGANLSSPDLRAGAALVIAALAAEGISEVFDIKYIERGYEDFPEKLRRLGAEIEKIDTEVEKRRFKFRVG